MRHTLADPRGSSGAVSWSGSQGGGDRPHSSHGASEAELPQAQAEGLGGGRSWAMLSSSGGCSRPDFMIHCCSVALTFMWRLGTPVMCVASYPVGFR